MYLQAGLGQCTAGLKFYHDTQISYVCMYTSVLFANKRNTRTVTMATSRISYFLHNDFIITVPNIIGVDFVSMQFFNLGNLIKNKRYYRTLHLRERLSLNSIRVPTHQ